jgi:Wyosine base formation
MAVELAAVQGDPDTIPARYRERSGAQILSWFGRARAELLGTFAGLDPAVRLRHVAHIGVAARAFSYAARGLPVPSVPVHVALTAPSGAIWTWGPADAADRVSGPALDFCLLVTQRPHRDDLALTAEGPAAEQWLAIAQAFAGPPGPGRRPGQFRS